MVAVNGASSGPKKAVGSNRKLLQRKAIIKQNQNTIVDKTYAKKPMLKRDHQTKAEQESRWQPSNPPNTLPGKKFPLPNKSKSLKLVSADAWWTKKGPKVKYVTHSYNYRMSWIIFALPNRRRCHSWDRRSEANGLKGRGQRGKSVGGSTAQWGRRVSGERRPEPTHGGPGTGFKNVVKKVKPPFSQYHTAGGNWGC